MTLSLLFLVIAIVLFAVAAFWTPSPRISLVALGLAFFAASFLHLS